MNKQLIKQLVKAALLNKQLASDYASFNLIGLYNAYYGMYKGLLIAAKLVAKNQTDEK